MLQPPGGGSSNLFGGYEDDSAASRRPNKMASKIFAEPEQPQSVPRRSNPPGQTCFFCQGYELFSEGLEIRDDLRVNTHFVPRAVIVIYLQIFMYVYSWEVGHPGCWFSCFIVALSL